MQKSIRRASVVTTGAIVASLAMLSACGGGSVTNVPDTLGKTTGATSTGSPGDAAALTVDGGFDIGAVDDGSITNAETGGCAQPNLTGVVRDFQFSHPDFEHFEGDGEKNAVLDALGADDKPVFSGTATRLFTTAANFNQWFHDTAGVNMHVEHKIELTKLASGIYSFNDQKWFPIDGQGFGNEGKDDDGTPHNYSFTFELHTTFAYQGGEKFTFTGDDDLWTFINGHLAIDLGGLHSAQTKTIELDALAASFGLEKGTTYPLAVFQAERHTTGSHFRIDTTIAFTNCTPIIQ